MANKNSEINIDIIAKDLATKTIKAVNDQMRDMGSASKEGSSGMTMAFTKAQLIVEGVKWGFQKLGNVVSGVTDRIKAVAEGVIDFGVEYSKRAGQIENVSVGFNKIFENSEEALKDLRKGAQGTISDFDLMLNANKASMLGVSSNSKQLADLLEISRARAQALGVDSTYAFESIATGIGRMSPLILDNLGITTGAYKEQLKALEDTGIVVTDVMKKELLLQTVLNDDSKVVMTLGVMWEQLTASFTNAKDNIATGLIPIFTDIGETVLPFVTTAMANLSDKFVAFALDIWPKVKESATEWKEFFLEWWEENDTVVMAQVERLNKALFGSDGSLGDSLMKLITPTEDSKETMKELMNDGVEKLTNALIGEDGEGGVVGAVNSFIGMIGEVNGDKVVTEFKKMYNAIKTVADIINALAEAWRGWGFILNGEVGTGGVETFIPDQNVIDNWEDAKNEWEKENIGVEIPFGSGIGMPDFEPFANGGLASGRVLVGERGAEIVDLPAGSQVHTNEASKGMGGGVTININAPITGVDHLREVITSAVDELQSSQNKLAQYNIL